MGGKRSPIRSRSIRWKPGRYRGRRWKPPRPQPFRPFKDSLIAAAAGLITATVMLLIAIPVAANFHIPLYAAFGGAMLLIAVLTARVAGRDTAGRLMAGVMAAICIVGTAGFYMARDELRVAPHPTADGAPMP